MLWAEAVYTRKRIINSMCNTGSTKNPSENVYVEKPKIIVFPQSLDALPTSLKGNKIRRKRQTRRTRTLC